MPATLAIEPVVECRSVVVPAKGGGRTKEIRHPFAARLEIPVLEEGEAPVVVRLRRVAHPEHLVHHGLPAPGWNRVVLDQTAVRLSTRNLPAVAMCRTDAVGGIETSMADEILFRRWANIRVACTTELGLDAREVVSSNADLLVGHLRRRAASMFVVGDLVYGEAPAPFLQAYGRSWPTESSIRLRNELPRDNMVLATMVVAAVDPHSMPEGAERHVETVQTRLPASWAVVRSIVRAVPAAFSEHNPDLLLLAGDLARASGLVADDVLAYDWKECRRIVEAMAGCAFKTTAGAGLASILESGILEEDVLVDRPGASGVPEADEAAFSMGL